MVRARDNSHAGFITCSSI